MSGSEGPLVRMSRMPLEEACDTARTFLRESDLRIRTSRLLLQKLNNSDNLTQRKLKLVLSTIAANAEPHPVLTNEVVSAFAQKSHKCIPIMLTTSHQFR